MFTKKITKFQIETIWEDIRNQKKNLSNRNKEKRDKEVKIEKEYFKGN